LNINTGEFDDRNIAYGLAFVLLTYAIAYQSGVNEVFDYIRETFDTLNNLWEEEHGLYADEATSDWSKIHSYRGQNCNMHACEALIEAYNATKFEGYLRKAKIISYNICVRQAKRTQQTPGSPHDLMYEHYTSDWKQADLKHNLDKPKDLFQPWGFQPGHLMEWAKLLLRLDNIQAEEWRLVRAQQLFDTAIKFGWDHSRGGFYYCCNPETLIPCDTEKYYWILAEAIITAALLGTRTQDNKYWIWYDKIWQYTWNNFVDHKYGGWYRVLSEENEKLSNLKSPPAKVDYHNIGAIFDCLAIMK